MNNNVFDTYIEYFPAGSLSNGRSFIRNLKHFCKDKCGKIFFWIIKITAFRHVNLIWKHPPVKKVNTGGRRNLIWKEKQDCYSLWIERYKLIYDCYLFLINRAKLGACINNWKEFGPWDIKMGVEQSLIEFIPQNSLQFNLFHVFGWLKNKVLRKFFLAGIFYHWTSDS